jgi:hypothetical protein
MERKQVSREKSVDVLVRWSNADDEERREMVFSVVFAGAVFVLAWHLKTHTEQAKKSPSSLIVPFLDSCCMGYGCR